MDVRVGQMIEEDPLTNEQFVRLVEIANSLRNWPEGKPLYRLIIGRLTAASGSDGCGERAP